MNLMKTNWLARVARTTKEFFLYEKSVHISRSQAMEEPIEALENKAPDTRNILQEYFIPPDQLQPFLEALQLWIKTHKNVELINGTVRWVNADHDSLLPYAPQDRFAVVLSINLPDTPAAEKAMIQSTRELIDATLNLGGRYYLPYILYATPNQFNHAYPEFSQLLSAKKQWDTGDLLTSRLYQTYSPLHKPLVRSQNPRI
ncbi:hypothetical protein E1189_08555 [Sansalvadorimonas verongulae]|nr:hypothetical protein [Sansalvadorimonas verongulae]